MRYSGSPLKYSFSEHLHKKSLVKAELRPEGGAETELLPLTPLRDMRKIKGPLAELTRPEIVAESCSHDYLHVTLTDDGEVYDAMGKLRSCYPNVMQLVTESAAARARSHTPREAEPASKTPLEMFRAFFELRNNAGMTAEQEAVIKGLLENI